MRIALLTGSTRPGRTLALAGALARAGAEVTAWVLAVAPVAAPAGVRLCPVPLPELPGGSPAARHARAVAALGAALARAGERYDVVHTQDAVSAAAAPSGVHTPDPADADDLGGAGARALVRTTPGGDVPPGLRRPVAVVPAGVDVDAFTAASTAAGAARRGRWRARLGRYVLAPAHPRSAEGVLDLVAATARLQAERPDLALVLLDGATLEDAVRTRVEVRAAERDVYPVLLPPVPDAELPALVAAADAFALPDPSPGWGPAALEALAAGVPLVTGDRPELRGAFGDAALAARGPAALAAALLRAAAEDCPVRRLAGQVLAGRHGWEAAALAHLELYRSLAATG
ncbi:glycosyltransferase [Geodermatophilus sp. SYSU D00758]